MKKGNLEKNKQTFYSYIYTIIFLPAIYSIETNKSFLEVITSKYIVTCIALFICIVLINWIDFLVNVCRH